MKEKQKRFLSSSDGYNVKAANPLTLQTQYGNDSRKSCELDCSNIGNGLSKDFKTNARVSPATDDNHSAVSRYLNGVKDTDMLNSDGNGKDLLSTPELECSIIMNDYSIHNKNDPADLVPPAITSSEMFQENRIMHTDEGVLDYEPELIVCYKEKNYNAKEIWADKYALDEESGDLHFELLDHDGFILSGENSDVFSTNKFLSKEDGNGVSTFASKSKSLADLINSDDQNSDVLLQASEKDVGIKIENDVTVKEPIVTRLLSMEKFGTRISNQSFSKSPNIQGDGAQQQKQVVEHADMDKRHHESVLDNENCYSKSPSIVSEILSSSLYGSSMNIRQETEPNNKDGYSINASKAQRTGMAGNNASEVQNADVEDNCENIHHQRLAANNIVGSENPFPLNECKTVSKSRRTRRSPQPPQHQSWSSDSHSNTNVLSAGVNEIGGNDPYATLDEDFDLEEIIIDGSGRITYSGAVTDSGSLSTHSESSTTSAKSFAFPVLKSEWTSSPIKMGSTNNRRQVKKRHGRWKRNFLCCRF